ncbi:stathmin domain-containing protein 1 [Cololabis saira]|uniref:stathmin domain-containing protein 1 n=1 Tax=Cololabis saira TaxID=129043 RepID=UPI002AD5A0B2|nr:stathmin domain-containing protein 1 [Cololabis saira]
MGCGSSTETEVQPLEGVSGDEDQRDGKTGGRGDSAVSKGTTDSGVMMEHRDILTLPGAVPSKLPPLTSESIGEREAERDTQDATAPGFPKQDSSVQVRPKSKEILEELLSQGIIPVGQSREGIMQLDNGEGLLQKPPARLESLKAKKAEHHWSREEMEEKMSPVEERCELGEENFKMGLRTKSVHVRTPALISNTEDDVDAFLTPVEALQSPPSPETSPAPEQRSPAPHKATEGRGWVRWAGGDGRECEDKVTGAGDPGAGEDGESAGDGEEEDEDVTQVEELKAGELLTTSGEVDSDSSFSAEEIL